MEKGLIISGLAPLIPSFLLSGEKEEAKGLARDIHR
jgi:hypothetical protein